MSLSAYLSQSQYFADELLDLLDEGEKQAAGALFDQSGYDLLVNIPPKDLKSLLVFLGKPPSEQLPQFQKLSHGDQLVFWLRARYMALSVVNGLTIADTAEMNVGRKYRQMHRAIATAVHPYPQLISKDDLLWREIH